MRIAILMLNIEKIDANKYYNSQAEGMAKALATEGNDVLVYHLIPDMEQERKIIYQETIRVCYIRTRHIGKHAIPKMSLLDKNIDCMIVCSDNYCAFPKVVKWCKKNNIKCLPYIGVLHSNNSNKCKRVLSTLLCNNIPHYRHMTVMVKSNQIAMELKQHGVDDVRVMPVGLDKERLNTKYASEDIAKIKTTWNYTDEEELILFVGRLHIEKQPLLMLELFRRIYAGNSRARLLIVGQGELEEQVRKTINDYNLQGVVRMESQVPNERMWELYCISRCFVNLNTHEIFGMAILEAMYYGCIVLALRAPGPEMIIDNYRTGYLCDNIDELQKNMQSVLSSSVDKRQMSLRAAREIEDRFTWETIIQDMQTVIEEGIEDGNKM